MKKIEEMVIAFCILAITVIMNVNVVMRHLFNRSWTPTEEVCLIFVVIATFVGSAYAARVGMHLFASLLFDIPRVPLRLKKALAVVIASLTAALCLLLTWEAANFVRQNYLSARTTPSLGIPFWSFYSVLPLAFLMMAWQNMRCVLLNLRTPGEYHIAPEAEEQ